MEISARWSIVVCLVFSAAAAQAQPFPTKPVRIISGQTAGGVSDLFARALAIDLAPAIGGTIYVENHAGADGSIGAKFCAEAAPDGHTICILNNESMVINPLIYPNIKLDPLADLAPITRLFYVTQVLSVTAELDVRSFTALAALAHAKPRTLSYSTASLSKVAFMQDFKVTRGTDIVRVPFKGGGDAVNGMLSGVTPITIIGIANVLPYLQNGAFVGLAVDGDRRSPLMPDIPTFKEQGLSRYPMLASFTMHAPAKTPAAIIDKFYSAIAQVAGRPEFQDKYMIARGLVPVLDAPAHLAEQLLLDKAEGREVVIGSGLHPNVK